MDVYKVKDMINCLLLNNQMKIEEDIRMQREGQKSLEHRYAIYILFGLFGGLIRFNPTTFFSCFLFMS